MLSLLLKPLSVISLPAIHRLGALLGYITYCLSPKSKQLIRENLLQSQLFDNDLMLNKTIKRNIIESGKSIIETFALWQKKQKEVLLLVKQVHGWNDVVSTAQSGTGIIFLTPHLGCFEVIPVYIAAHYPLTVLFRPPKIKRLAPIIEQGRTRPGVTLAEANTSGVRKLMQSLKKGGAVGILPDQIPSAGEGEWAPFFSKPAYTMTLASKLASKTGASVIMVFAERLPKGEGYTIHFTKLDNGAIATTALLNQAIEQQVAKNPSQYLWNYPRYKVRRRAKSMGENIDSTTEKTD